MATMDELYQSVIIEHDRSPRNFRTLAAPTHDAAAFNPLCGDEMSLQLKVDDAGVIEEVGFQGRGCAVSKAAASMMTSAVIGMNVAEARKLADAFQTMLTGGEVDVELLGKLRAFKGLGAYPMRVKCATMAWHALREALSE